MSKYILVFSLVVLSVFAAACSSGSSDAAGKTIKSGSSGNNLTATISNPDGVLKKG